MNAWDLLPLLRELFSRLPETYHLQPWELQHVFFSLGYTDDLAEEARGDWSRWEEVADVLEEIR